MKNLYSVTATVVCLVGCKTTAPSQSLLRDAPDGAPAVTLPQALTPLQGALFGAASLSTDTCFGSAGTWSPAAQAAFPTPEVVPPGTLRLVRQDKVTSPSTGWTRTPHASIANFDVFDTTADSFDQLVGRFASADPAAVAWHLDRDFGAALTAALANVPAPRGRYGMVLLRKTLANQQLTSAVPAPQGVDKSSASYNRCGDGYVMGQVLADNFLVLIATADAAKRDAATSGVREISLQRGDFDQSLDAVDRALSTDGSLLTLEQGSAGLAFVAHPIGEAEAALNAWRGNDQPSGVRSVLGAVQLYPAYAGADADAGTAQLNPALTALAVGRNSLRAQTDATKKQAQQQTLAGFEQQILSCGGRRFAPGGTGPAPACTALATPTQLVGAVAISDDRLNSAYINWANSAGDYNVNSCSFNVNDQAFRMRRPNRGEFLTMLNAPAFKTKLYDRFFKSRSFPPGVFDSIGPDWSPAYVYVWIRRGATEVGKVAARIEDKRMSWADKSGGVNNPNPYTDDYPFEATFVNVTERLSEYKAGDVCISPAPGEPTPEFQAQETPDGP